MGKATELRDTTNIVKKLLEEEPSTRNSDELLYKRYCEIKDPTVLMLSLGAYLEISKHLNIAQFHSVKRTRRKVQKEYPHLRANADVEAWREVNEKVYREYSKSII